MVIIEGSIVMVLGIVDVTLLEVVGGEQIVPFEQWQVPMLSQL